MEVSFLKALLLHKEIKINNKKMDENPSSYFMEKSVNIKE
jgi:hypothetical protein